MRKRKLLVLIALILIMAVTLCACATFEVIPNGGSGDGGSGDSGSGDSGSGDSGSGDSGSGDSGSGDSGSGDGNENPPAKTYKVTLILGEGATVEGDNPVSVTEGGTATFKLNIADGYVFSSVTLGSYNQSERILTVENVRSNTRVYFLTEEFAEELVQEYIYVFRPGYNGDTTTATSSTSLAAGTLVEMSATDPDRVFVGWTVGALRSDGGTVVSLDRQASLRVGSDLADSDGRIVLFSNYVDGDGIYYCANGGQVNLSSQNMTNTEHYSVNSEGERIHITYTDTYLDYMEAACSFFDDGSFTREGYILCEYNTAPDGSGISYSLGSKVPLVLPDGSVPTLYCIWAKESDPFWFDYVDVRIPRPEGVTEAYAPHWVEEGIKITGYCGSDKTVVIPDMIDGKQVIALGTGAFNYLDMETLVMGRHILRVENNAFINCDSLTTVYFPDGIYDISNSAFDEATYSSFKNLYVNATIAPRYVGADNGALSVKLSRLMAYTTLPRLVVIGGSSAYQGLGTEYLEALLDGEWRVVNFGTTRTTHGAMYLEAMSAFTDSDDVIVYAPENSAYMFGERELYWKTLRDLESMNNIFRYVDISNYTNVFGAFADFNQNYRYNTRSCSPHAYEDIVTHGSLGEGEPYQKSTTNKYGDYQLYKRVSLVTEYKDAYYITLNERVKSKDEGWWYEEDFQREHSDYTDMSDITWASISDSYFADLMNHAIASAGSSGATVMFGFCPTDRDALVEGAQTETWQEAYDSLILEIYGFDGIVGGSGNYVFDHDYFYDCAFHLNDYGRATRTYRMYRDLVGVLGVRRIKAFTDVGTVFEGCLFEEGSLSEDVLFEGEDPNTAYFTYADMENGAKTVTGLTELGKSQTVLTLPLGVDGVKVMGISEGAFRDGSVEKLVISEDSNLAIIYNGAFTGADTLRELWIYKASGDAVSPPASFSGVAEGFTVHVPEGSDYSIHYYWGERGLSFVYDANRN